MQRTAVVLFARSPEHEAAAKGMRSAAPLFRRVIAAWLEAAWRAGSTPLIACEERERHALSAIAPAIPRQWLSQRGHSFGERVANAAQDALAQYDAVVLAAIDAPPPPTLVPLLGSVLRGSTVVAPARDGGVNYIAFSCYDRALFENLTLARCRARVRNLVVLDAISDVDSKVALDFARTERAWRKYLTPSAPRSNAVAHSLSVRTVRPSAPRAPPA